MSINRVNRIYLYIIVYQNSTVCRVKETFTLFSLHVLIDNIGTFKHLIIIIENILNVNVKFNTVFGVLYRI